MTGRVWIFKKKTIDKSKVARNFVLAKWDTKNTNKHSTSKSVHKLICLPKDLCIRQTDFLEYVGCGGICLTWNTFVLRKVSHNFLDTEKKPICWVFFFFVF